MALIECLECGNIFKVNVQVIEKRKYCAECGLKKHVYSKISKEERRHYKKISGGALVFDLERYIEQEIFKKRGWL